MRREYKFQALQDYLLICEKDEVELTFEQIEDVLGFKLSDSAYKYDQYWRNSPTHTITLAWEKAGYEIGKLAIENNKILFVKSNLNYHPLLKENVKTKSTIRKNNNLVSEETVNYIVEEGNKYFEELKNDNNARYLSWEHCYKVFQEYKGEKIDDSAIDYLSLQLAFYLASWGMYRGSSFLLQKDYKVHKEAVIEIYKPEYKPLWSIKCKEYGKMVNQDLLSQLYQNLMNIYVEHRSNIDNRKVVSDTLLTKILMGTMGCVPAYDRYFISGINTYKVAETNYGINSIADLSLFYEDNKNKLEIMRNKISRNDLDYPQMKILDMCFWQVGYDLDSMKDK